MIPIYNTHNNHHLYSLTPLSLQQQPTSTQTLPSLHSLQLHNPNSTSPRLILGPAGPVEAAMLRKARAIQNPSSGCGGDDPIIATQEYIRWAVEVNYDFNCNPWLCALQFLGIVDGALPIAFTPLNSIKIFTGIAKVDWIVAVIKSSTPNGLGDRMVTLKDPTGTIDASIHHKVIAEVEFG